MKYVISTKLNILSKSNEPTFLNIRSWQVIGLTLGITLVGDLVPDWHVPSEESLSDHRYICFRIEPPSLSGMKVMGIRNCVSVRLKVTDLVW